MKIIVCSVNAICFLSSIILGFYKTGSDTEKLHPMTTEPKINKIIYSKHYALHDQLEIFIVSLFLFILNFAFLCFFASFFLFFPFYMKAFAVIRNFVILTQLYSVAIYWKSQHKAFIYIYHYFNCYCPRAKEIPNIIHTGRNILKKYRKYLLFI